MMILNKTSNETKIISKSKGSSTFMEKYALNISSFTFSIKKMKKKVRPSIFILYFCNF